MYETARKKVCACITYWFIDTWTFHFTLKMCSTGNFLHMLRFVLVSIASSLVAMARIALLSTRSVLLQTPRMGSEGLLILSRGKNRQIYLSGPKVNAHNKQDTPILKHEALCS